MISIIQRFKNREFCIDRYTHELHDILMEEDCRWKNPKVILDLRVNWYEKVAVRSHREVYSFYELSRDSKLNKVMPVKDFINQYRKEKENIVGFTKDDLIMGKHVVEFRNGRKGLYVMNGFHDESGDSISSLNYVDKDLTSRSYSLDIVRVFEIEKSNSSYSLHDKIESAKLVWERSEPEQEKLRSKIDELEAKLQEVKTEFSEWTNKEGD